MSLTWSPRPAVAFAVLIALPLIGLPLGGCAVTTGYAVATAHPSTSLARGPSEAWASLPPAAGKVLSVTEQDTPPRLTQRIVLDGAGPIAGENFISVATVDPQSSARAFGNPPTPADIEADMAIAVPGVDMRRTLSVEQNRLGPFGTAFGSKGAYNCLYAWQRSGGSGQAFGPSSVPVDIRVRLCRKVSQEVLVGYIRGLNVYVGPSTTVDVSAGALTVDPLAAAAGSMR